MAITDTPAAARKASTAAKSAVATTREEELEAQVAQLQDDLKSITETLAKLSGEKFGEAKAVAKTEFKHLKRKGEEVLSDAQDQAEHVEKQLKDTIREKPLTSVATALGVGFVLALLTRH